MPSGSSPNTKATLQRPPRNSLFRRDNPTAHGTERFIWRRILYIIREDAKEHKNSNNRGNDRHNLICGTIRVRTDESDAHCILDYGYNIEQEHLLLIYADLRI